MPDQALHDRAEAVRKFNRFYTRHIGVLHEYLLASEFSLTEVRILYELAHRPAISTSDLCRELNLDAGYVSRVVSGFEKKGLIVKTRSAADARVGQLGLTDEGRAAFAPLDNASRDEVIAVLEALEFSCVRQRGSHKQFRHVDGRATTVPDHGGRDISPSLLRKIANDIGMTVEEFVASR